MATSEVLLPDVAASDIQIGAVTSGYLDKKRPEKKFLTEKYQKRWCVIHDGIFYYFATPEDKRQKYAFLLQGYHFRHRTQPAMSFSLAGDHLREFTFMAPSQEELAKWKKAITHSAHAPTRSLLPNTPTLKAKKTQKKTNPIGVNKPLEREQPRAHSVRETGAHSVDDQPYISKHTKNSVTRARSSDSLDSRKSPRLYAKKVATEAEEDPYSFVIPDQQNIDYKKSEVQSPNEDGYITVSKSQGQAVPRAANVNRLKKLKEPSDTNTHKPLSDKSPNSRQLKNMHTEENPLKSNTFTKDNPDPLYENLEKRPVQTQFSGDGNEEDDYMEVIGDTIQQNANLIDDDDYMEVIANTQSSPTLKDDDDDDDYMKFVKFRTEKKYSDTSACITSDDDSGGDSDYYAEVNNDTFKQPPESDNKQPMVYDKKLMNVLAEMSSHMKAQSVKSAPKLAKIKKSKVQTSTDDYSDSDSSDDYENVLDVSQGNRVNVAL